MDNLSAHKHPPAGFTLKVVSSVIEFPVTPLRQKPASWGNG